jgi:hypothetical protein
LRKHCSRFVHSNPCEGNAIGHGDFAEFNASGSVIGGGYGNYPDESGDSIIGAVAVNVIGYDAAGFNAGAAAIVAGENLVQGADSLIGTGTNNSMRQAKYSYPRENGRGVEDSGADEVPSSRSSSSNTNNTSSKFGSALFFRDRIRKIAPDIAR